MTVRLPGDHNWPTEWPWPSNPPHRHPRDGEWVTYNPTVGDSTAQALLDNLTATQERCTRQEQEIRDLREELKFFSIWEKSFAPRIGKRLVEARAKHPEGVNLAAAVSEMGEVATAILCETPERVEDEILDCIAIWIRWLNGEVKRG